MVSSCALLGDILGCWFIWFNHCYWNGGMC